MELLCLWQCSKQTISPSLTSFQPFKSYLSSVHPVLFTSIAAALLQTLITFSFLLNVNVSYFEIISNIQKSSQNSHIPLNQNSQLLTFYHICPTVPCSIYIYTHMFICIDKVYICMYINICNPWTVACQDPLSMEFSRQEYWSGLPFPSPVYLPDPGIKPRSPTSQADSLPSETWGKS